MELKFTSRTYRLTGLTPLLGTQAASRSIRTEYIASKAPTDALREEEEANPFDLDAKGLTVFMRDGREQLCLLDYQIKGFFKESIQALRPQLNIAAAKGKVDTLIFVEPRYIPLKRDGQPFLEEDEQLERSLRTDGPMGPRTCLQASEMINDPWEIEIEITLFGSNGSGKSSPLTWEAVELALDYGAFHGLGQWRNAGYGRFTWARTDDGEGEEAQGDA